MSSPADKTADFVKTHYSSIGLEVTNVNRLEHKISVWCPSEITELTELLQEVYDETGASADYNLTSEGAALTFWVPPHWEKQAEKPRPWLWYIASALSVLAVAVAAAPAMRSAANQTNEPAGENASENVWWW